MSSTDLSETEIQRKLTAAVKAYVARREAGVDFSPFEPDAVTATDVAVVATSMLKAVQLEVFELTLWSAWGRIDSSSEL
jgi:hypothetical protein